mgnify:FL=1|tara:strand:+ start:241 stop:1155 length:915 start_codon:yes stop_codon:yes gene_type:complete
MPSDDTKNPQYKGVENASDNLKVEEVEPSTLETIDYAFYDFINETMNSNATTNEGSKKVKIVWATAERAFLSKDDKDVRDADGTLILPLISIERTSVEKSLTRKGSYYGLSDVNVDDKNRYGRVTLARKIVPDKTNNFAVADNRKKFGDVTRTPNRQSHYPIKKNQKVVYETLSIPLPVSVVMNYTVSLYTDYIQQMNTLMSPFITLGSAINSFSIRRDNHKYEAFLQSSLNQQNNFSNMTGDTRIIKSALEFEVIGYLIGESPNGERPKIIKKQNFVEVKLGRERVIVGAIPDYGDGKSFYRD